MTGFDRFELPEPLLHGIRAAGFQDPCPIQIETIPAGLEERDVLGLAQTGTGKTAAFALPLLQNSSSASSNSSSRVSSRCCSRLLREIAAVVAVVTRAR